MPSIAFKSKIRTSSDYWALTLIIHHHLVVGQPSETIHEMKLSLPKPVDVCLDSQLRITISGLLNGDKIAPAVLQDSCIARHLVEYLSLNANELGIAVSEMHISEDTGLPTFICTSSRPFQTAPDNPFRTTLVGLNLTYVWQTTPGLSDDHVKYPEIVPSMNPFSRKRLSLPCLTAVNTIVQKFVTFQLVKRYPLIFGSWAQQLNVEFPLTVSIHKSLSHIISRSPHSKFQVLCKKLSKLSMKRIASGSLSVTGILSVYLGTEGQIDALEPMFSENEEHEVSTAMMNFYHLSLRRPLFKGLSLSHIADDHEDFFDDSSEQNNTISYGAKSCSETYQMSPQQNFENDFDLEDNSGYNSDGNSPSFHCLYRYPDSPSSLPWDAKTLLRDSYPELGIMEPENHSVIIALDGFSDTEEADESRWGLSSKNPSHPAVESRTPSSDHQRHKLSNVYPGWSPDIDSSQEKLDRSPVGMSIAQRLSGPCMERKSPVVLDLPCLEFCPEPSDKEFPENFNNSDFEDRSGSKKEDTIEFGTSTLQFDSDSGSSSTTSDGHEIIAFECMGNQRLSPLTPCSSISSEEHTSFGTNQMECEEDKVHRSGEGGFGEASQDHGRFLLLDFE